MLERSKKLGIKILMSGGGRCNFTNLHIEPECYLSANPHFCKSALKRYTQWDFIDLVEKHGVSYHEREHGQLFCDDSADDTALSRGIRLLQRQDRRTGRIAIKGVTAEEYRR